MIGQIKHWFEPPYFPGDEEKTAQARLMHTVGLYFVLALMVAAITYVPFFAKHKVASWGIILVLLVLYLIARIFLFRGHLAFAGLFLAFSGWTICEGLVFIGGGIASPMMFALAAITIAAGLLFHARVRVIFLGLSILFGLGFALLQQNGFVLPRIFNYSPLGIWFYFALSLVFINWTMNLTVRELENVLAQVRRQNDVREKTEATLRESESKYRKLHESICDGFVYVDMAGRIKEFNEVYRQMLGYDSRELERLTYFDLTPERWHEVEQKIVQEQILSEGYSSVYEKEYRKKDGTIFPVELRTFLIKDESGNNQGMSAIVRDITERKHAEEAVRLSEARYRQAITAAGAVPYYRDYQNEIHAYTFMGEGILQLTGYSAAEITPDIFDQLECESIMRGSLAHLTPDEAGDLSEAGKIRHWACDYRIQTRDGQMRWVSDAAIQIRGENNQRLGVIGILQDITDRKRAEESEREQRTLAEALSSSAAALNSTLNFNDVLDRILDNVGRVVPHDAANIMFLDEDGDTLSVVCNRGYLESDLSDIMALRLSLKAIPILVEAARTGQPLIISDTHADPAWISFPSTRWICSYLTVPIQVRQNTVGFLNLDSATSGFFNSNHAERLLVFANQSAIAIENARLYEEVQKLALTDTLTGIFNRAFFEAEVSRMELSRDFPVSIVIVDLDNMKITNDVFGHLAGDELLRRTVKVLQAAFRTGDVIARIGGDEFAVLLPNTDSAMVEQILLRVQSKLAEYNAAQTDDLPVYLSVGASTAERGKLMEAFILADQQMYKNKAARKSKDKLPPLEK